MLKVKVVFQPLFFRGHSRFREKTLQNPPKKQLVMENLPFWTGKFFVHELWNRQTCSVACLIWLSGLLLNMLNAITSSVHGVSQDTFLQFSISLRPTKWTRYCSGCLFKQVGCSYSDLQHFWGCQHLYYVKKGCLYLLSMVIAWECAIYPVWNPFEIGFCTILCGAGSQPSRVLCI